MDDIKFNLKEISHLSHSDTFSGFCTLKLDNKISDPGFLNTSHGNFGNKYILLLRYFILFIFL